MLTTSFQNNVAYTSLVEKKFHNFKLIEILNESEIKEHFRFVHPFYGKGKYQRIYLANNMEYMLERLINQKVLLYKRAKGMFGSCKWQMVKRINRFPMDMSEGTYMNFLFSPDLMYYLDFDKSNNQFIIKETLTQTPYRSIPIGLMGVSESETVNQIARRFMWIDANTVRITNIEGLEKMVDITNGFKEISYASVPLFAVSKAETYKHYYYDKPSLELGNTYQRLIRKLQAHKAAYFL